MFAFKKRLETLDKVNINGVDYHKFTRSVYFMGMPWTRYEQLNSTIEAVKMYSESDKEGKIGFGIAIGK